MRFGPRSLRNRLVLGAAALGLVFSLLFGLVATWRISSAESQAIGAALHSRLELARDEVSPSGSIATDIGNPKTDLVQVVGSDGRVVASTASLSGVGPLVDVGAVAAAPTGLRVNLSLQDPDVDLALLAVPYPLARHGTGALVVAVDAEGFDTANGQIRELLVVGLGAVVLAMIALAWIVAGRVLETVTRITRDAERVAPRDLAEGLPAPPGDTELANLVAALNRMLARVHVAHATELAFAVDAGHRLRTPVATLRAETELALRETDPAELRVALTRILQDADRLTAIVNRMLTRSRSSPVTPVPIRDTLVDAAARWARQAEISGANLTVAIDETLPGEACGKEPLEVVQPIVDNAMRHAPRDGVVDIDIRLSGDRRTVVVTISNTGDPVPAELVPRIFDAWVSTRDASVAGGLGLWLARETARDHGGEVELTARTPRTVFRVRIPVV